MQLEPREESRPRTVKHKKKMILTSLVAATSALLGSAPGPSIASENLEKWQFDTSVAYYGESDRVQDTSARLLATKRLSSGSLFTLRAAIDTLTGASANGAVPSRYPQTFTGPSGGSSYQVSPGEVPLDPTFTDSRLALSANWLRPLGSRVEFDLGGSVSKETDYLHLGLNARLNRDFNQRNTRLTFGAALAADTVEPPGGVPMPFAVMMPQTEGDDDRGDDRDEDEGGGGGGGGESKTVADFFVGLTQVFGKRTIGQLNYSLSASTGYLNDPYKILSVLDPVTADPVPGPPGLNLYLYESRPDRRVKHSLFGMIKHKLGRQVVDISYRYMTDDWGIDSHTVDLHWRSPVGARWYLQPHLRYYTQTAADFYQPYLLDGNQLPDHASADYRLGDLDGSTVGMKIGRALRGAGEYSVRVEYYQQSGRSPPGASFGSLDGYDLFPSIGSVIVQFGFRF
jgi:hypothetical protein